MRTLLIVLGFSASAALAQQPCLLKEGDSLEAAKRQFGIDANPTRQASVTPGGTTYQYSLPDLGVWIFFDSRLRVSSLRFNKPYAGKVAGVAIGDDKDHVRRLLGEPQSVMSQGMVDVGDLQARRDEKKMLLDLLPDPAPRHQVMRAFEEMQRIDARPFKYMTGWIYNARSPDFVRFDFGSPGDTVQIIFSRRCA